LDVKICSSPNGIYRFIFSSAGIAAISREHNKGIVRLGWERTVYTELAVVYAGGRDTIIGRRRRGWLGGATAIEKAIQLRQGAIPIIIGLTYHRHKIKSLGARGIRYVEIGGRDMLSGNATAGEPSAQRVHVAVVVGLGNVPRIRRAPDSKRRIIFLSRDGVIVR
jgi:hypothetical protein